MDTAGRQTTGIGEENLSDGNVRILEHSFYGF